MSLLGMPWAVVNLGCEMIYILDQRLKAQGIPQDKCAQVLQDIVSCLFDQTFVRDKLFVPQDMYSPQSTRKIFDRLAHSSIMRLSESSMDKLFDLMVMGAKYQLVCSARLDDLIQVMLRHLGTARAILTSAMAGCSHAGAVKTNTIDLISQAEQATIKMFFQDKRVKVSLFLNEGIQLQAGKLVVPGCIKDQVGLVRTFGKAGGLEAEERHQLSSQKVHAHEFFCHPVPLGDNLYCKDRPKVVAPVRGADAIQHTDKVTQEPQEKQLQQEQPSSVKPSHSSRYADGQQNKVDNSAARELHLLAALVNVSNTSSTDNFKLNLFGDPAEEESGTVESSQRKNFEKHQQLQFGQGGRNAGYMEAAGLSTVLQGVTLDSQQHNAGKTVGEDLLDLMDSVA
eukprot:gene5653-5892_t